MSDSVDSSVYCQRQWQQVVCVFAASLVESVGLSSFSISRSNYWSRSLLGCVLHQWAVFGVTLRLQSALKRRDLLHCLKDSSSAGGETESGIFTFVFLLISSQSHSCLPHRLRFREGGESDNHILQPPSTQSRMCSSSLHLSVQSFTPWIWGSGGSMPARCCDTDDRGPGCILHSLLVFMVQSYYFYAHFEFAHHRISQEVLQETD